MKYINDAVETPTSLVDENGEFLVGTFKSSFTNFNFSRFRRTFLKKARNNVKLTEWQAVEVLADQLFLIAAVFKFGPMNKTLLIAYDIKEEKLYDFSETSYCNQKSLVAPFLQGGSESTRKSEDSFIRISTNLEKGKLSLTGYSKELQFDIDFERIADPSIVSIQMAKKSYVYTEKDLLVPSGTIEFQGNIHTLSTNNITILDDHRGFYPLSSGYDWITCMGDIDINGEMKKFGLNITDFYRNLSKEVHENGYWLDGKFRQLPLASFVREDNTWYIMDEDEIIDLTFTLKAKHKIKKIFPLHIDYVMAFGSLTGTIQTDHGELVIDEMFSLAEKRLSKFMFGKTGR